MPTDKSLFFYGPLYHKFFDPQLADARQVAVDLVAEGSSVLDIACGTGLLCSMLRENKNCRVVGIDLSLRMLEFARKSSPYHDIAFRHEDATDLRAFDAGCFDYATILMLMHELPRPHQLAVLKEALRVARRAIIIDSLSPLPRNSGGIGIRVVEATVGHDHNPNFNAYLASGGLAGLLKEAVPPVTVEERRVFWHDCREGVLVGV